MLTKCPECELQISDKAISCPHCGYPLKPNAPRQHRPRKHKRLPNGFGQISEIKTGNLRKPFRAMVTVGKTETGRPICKLLQPESYFKTYNEAYEALLAYNRRPYDLDSKNITLEEVYNEWAPKYYERLNSKSSAYVYRAAWKHIEPLYKMKISEIRIKTLRSCIEDSLTCPPSLKKRVKMLFNLLWDYAVEQEYVDKNIAREFKLNDKYQAEPHISFSDGEMERLWHNRQYFPVIDLMLVQCYSGWRPQELIDLRIENINLDEGWYIGGMKTEAGKNRKVPIHKRIFHIVEAHYKVAVANDEEYLFINRTKKYNYNAYHDQFKKVLEKLDLDREHKPHDCRKQFVTMAKKYKVDEYAIKRIVGHAINDITESIYTDRDFNWYKEEIEKIL